MPQINDIRELAQQNARYVSNSPQDWMSYLDVAARLYRYSFTDALLIHAQRPDATACAELELWNQKMSRWVNRGAKGIALLDDTGPRTKLRYVFDIADTHLVRGGKTPLLWNLDSHEHEQAILDHLVDTYGLSQTDSMNTALLELAQQLTADNQTLPCTDIVLNDRYLFVNTYDLVECNLRPLLTVLAGKVRNRINIVVFTKSKTLLEFGVDKATSIIKDTLEKTTGMKPNVTFVTSIDNDKIPHDRFIITNYRLIRSGDSFLYFDTNLKSATTLKK